jgi:O-antigen ligase
MTDRTDLKKKNSLSGKIIVFLMIMATSLVPLLIYVRIDLLGGRKKEFWSNLDKKLDIFTLIKSEVLILIGAFLLITFLFIIIQKGFKLNIKLYHKLVLVFLGFVLLSSLVSEYKYISFNGFLTRYEGFFVYFVYIIIFLSTTFFISKYSIERIVFFILISACIMSILGIAQYYGKDFLDTAFVKILILPPRLMHLIDDFHLRFNKEVYGTLFNPNYMGSYTALLLPLAVGHYFKTKMYNKKAIFSIIACCLIFFSWMGSFSRAGYAGIIVGSIVFLILSLKAILYQKKAKDFIILGILFVLIAVLINVSKENKIFNEFKRLDTISSETDKPKDNVIIEDIVVAGYEINVKTNIMNLDIVRVKEKVYFLDDKEQVSVEIIDNKIVFKDEKYKSIYIETYKGESKITIHLGRKEVDFYYTTEGVRFLNGFGRYAKIDNPESVMDSFLYNLFEARGYIWSRTIPILKETLFIGKGPDTFIAYFPQNDLGGRMKFLNPTVIVDKPHNHYLQIGMNIGVVGLIIFLIFIYFYFRTGFKGIRKTNKEKKENFLEAGMISGIVAFLVSLVFNDSYIGIMPIFWFIMGASFSLNEVLLKKDDKILSKTQIKK